MSEPGSSQGTNEDPCGPLSSASEATLLLYPNNPEAKLAFSELVDWFTERPQRQGDEDQGSDNKARDHVSKYVWFQQEQIRDRDVENFLSQSASSSSPHSPMSERVSHGAPPPKHLQVQKRVWTGCFFIDLMQPPLKNNRGWAMGRYSPGESYSNDFTLSIRDSSSRGIRRHHSFIQVHQSGRMYIKKVSERALVEINGEILPSGATYVFNQPQTNIRCGTLQFRVEYGRFCQTEHHEKRLAGYVERLYGSSATRYLQFTPTPVSKTNIQVGQWIATNAGTVGIGGNGRISVAMNTAGEIVALKRISVTKASASLKRRQETLTILSDLAVAAKEDRIVRLLEVLTDDPKGNNRTADVWFVLTPFVTRTLDQWEGRQQPDQVASMTRAILEAVSFLHSHNWIHCDLKPANIGVYEWDSREASIVLLDIDDAVYAPDGLVPAAPGTSGTVGWISPEREMDGFTSTTDVWSIGVIGLQLLLGYHPWRTMVNPWRKGIEYEQCHPRFHRNYKNTIQHIQSLKLQGLGPALINMVRHPYANIEEQKAQRSTCSGILALLGPSEVPAPNNTRDRVAPKRRLLNN